MNEHLFVAVVGIFTLILLILIFRPFLNAVKIEEKILNELAKKFNGKVDLVRPRGVMQLTFSYQGIDISFYSYPDYRQNIYTFLLEAEFPNVKEHGSFVIGNANPFKKRKGIGANLLLRGMLFLMHLPFETCVGAKMD